MLPPSFDLQDGDKNGLRVFRGLPPQAGCPSCCYSVVVNADDLGYCDERDRGIVEAFKGGVVLVSHDFRLIDQVAEEIWVCEEKGVTKFDGAIRDYKKILAKKMEKHKVRRRGGGGGRGGGR